MTRMLVAVKDFKAPIITKLSSGKHWFPKCGPKASFFSVAMLEIQIVLLQINRITDFRMRPSSPIFLKAFQVILIPSKVLEALMLRKIFS